MKELFTLILSPCSDLGPAPQLGSVHTFQHKRDPSASSSAISIIEISSHISVLTPKQPHLVLFTFPAGNKDLFPGGNRLQEIVAPVLTWKAKTNR